MWFTAREVALLRENMRISTRGLFLFVLVVLGSLLFFSSKNEETRTSHHIRQLQAILQDVNITDFTHDTDRLADDLAWLKLAKKTPPSQADSQEWLAQVFQQFKDKSNPTGIRKINTMLMKQAGPPLVEVSGNLNSRGQKDDAGAFAVKYREDAASHDDHQPVRSEQIFSNLDVEDYNDKKSAADGLNTEDYSNNAKGGVTKVLLVTYMRGGSSLLGEAFNQNPDAFYWFEPVDAFYGHLYGTRHGFLPLDIFFNSNRTVRKIPQLEKDTIIKGLRDIYNCDFEEAPADLLSNLNLLNIIHNSTSDFAWCIRKGINKRETGFGTLEKYITSPVYPSFACKKTTDSVCPRRFTPEKILESCYKDLHYNSEGRPTNKIPGAGLDEGYEPKFFNKRVLSKYNSCLNMSYTRSQVCIHLLDRSCKPTKLRAIKAIRVRIDLLEDIIEAIPDIKVVIYFRDPRAIVLSRYYHVLLANISNKIMRNEGALLCQRMRYELAALPNLLDKYPRNIHVLQYEDVAKAPSQNLRDIYKFIGANMHPSVVEWLGNNLEHAKKNDGPYGTSRRDPVATSEKWRKMLRPADAEALGKACSDVLSALRYEI